MLIKRPTNKELHELIEPIKIDHSFDCKENIMNCIKSGQSKMRARWLVLTEYFGLRTTWILLVLLVVGLINLNLFIIQQGPQWNFIEFGVFGWGIFLRQFPYGWMVLVILLFMVAVISMRRFSWSYHYSFKAFIVILMGGVTFAGTVTFLSGINNHLYQKLVEEPGVGNSLLAKLYCLTANRQLNSSNALLGEVMLIEDQSMVVQTPTLEIVTVNLEQADWPVEIKTFEMVKMIGIRDNDSFQASVIRQENHDFTITREFKDCVDKESWQRKQEVVKKRHRAVNEPLSPVQGTVQLIRSIN